MCECRHEYVSAKDPWQLAQARQRQQLGWGQQELQKAQQWLAVSASQVDIASQAIAYSWLALCADLVNQHHAKLCTWQSSSSCHVVGQHHKDNEIVCMQLCAWQE
jgi:hypothetical protein